MNNILFSVDTPFNRLKCYHGVADPNHDISKVMKSLGIGFDIFLAKRSGLNSIFFMINEDKFSYLEDKLNKEYGALVYRIDGEDLIGRDEEEYKEGSLFVTKDYLEVRGQDYFWNRQRGYYLGVRR